ncbi:hypothetical protein Tco_0336379 [Tanacetum coccineum]
MFRSSRTRLHGGTYYKNRKKEKNVENNEVVDKNVIELSELNAMRPNEVVNMKKELEDGANNEPILKSLCRVEEKIEDDIDPVAPTNTVSRLILEWEERIKLHQEKEMKFSQWRSKVFNDGRFILVNEGCEVSDEGGVT